MKTLLKYFVVVAITSVFSLSINAQEKAKEIPAAKEKENTFIVNVDFHCGHGVTRLQNGLGKIEGVKKVEADLKTKNVTIEHNSEVVSTEQLVRAIEKIGHRTEYTPKDKKIKSACSHRH